MGLKRREYLFLLAMTFLAFFLRLWNASDISLGDDSSWAQLVNDCIHDPIRMIFPHYAEGPFANSGGFYARPVITILFGIPTILIGASKYTMILPEAIFTALSTILMYMLVKRLSGAKQAYIAALLFAFSPFLLAFTRIGLLHIFLIFFSLLSLYLLILYLDGGKTWLIYASSLCLVLGMWTSPFRGLLAYAAAIPLVWLHYKRKGMDRKVRHLAYSLALCAGIYFAYFIAAWAALGSPEHLMNLIDMGRLATGQGHESTYTPIMPLVMETAKYLYLTPFLGLILVPAMYGAYISVRARKREHMFWIFYLLPTILIYLEGQFSPERHLPMLPAYVAFAAIGLERATTRGRDYIWLSLATSLSYLLMIGIFPLVFPAESAAGILKILGMPSLLLIASATILGHAALYFQKPSRRFALISIAIVILANALFSFAAVGLKMGIYHRTLDTGTLGHFLKENMGSKEYSCVAGLESRIFTYYTGRGCAYWLAVDEAWLEENRDSVKYLIVNTHYADGTIGLGRTLPNGELDITNARTDEWNMNYPEKYAWLKENTIDITESVGVKDYRVYEII